LEYGEKEKYDTNSGGKRHGGVKNVGVNSVNGDAKKGDDNREFGDDTGQNIE
jgi:hypothetical protein